MIRARASDPRVQGMEKPAGISASVHFIKGGETVGKNANNHSIFREYSRASNFFSIEERRGGKGEDSRKFPKHLFSINLVFFLFFFKAKHFLLFITRRKTIVRLERVKFEGKRKVDY